MTTIKRERLPNGLEIVFDDQSNRYFGDYHRVCVVATLKCPVAAIQDEALRAQAGQLYGETLVVEKRFERMGVSSDEVENVRSRLIDEYMRSASAYLSRPDYPVMLVSAEMKKRRSSRFYV